ncbi:8635_t:CDS:2, partial [Cetraspora pellucida]
MSIYNTAAGTIASSSSIHQTSYPLRHEISDNGIAAAKSKKFHLYLHGFHFTLVTDHTALTYLNNMSNPTDRIA